MDNDQFTANKFLDFNEFRLIHRQSWI